MVWFCLFDCDFVCLFVFFFHDGRRYLSMGKKKENLYLQATGLNFFFVFILCFVLLLKHLRIKIPFRGKSKGVQWLFLTTEISLWPFQSLSNFLKTKIIYSIGCNCFFWATVIHHVNKYLDNILNVYDVLDEMPQFQAVM